MNFADLASGDAAFVEANTLIHYFKPTPKRPRAGRSVP